MDQDLLHYCRHMVENWESTTVQRLLIRISFKIFEILGVPSQFVGQSAVRRGPVQGGNGWFGLREPVRSCTSGRSQFPALSSVKGTSPAQVWRA
jgi:hypothetical protein